MVELLDKCSFGIKLINAKYLQWGKTNTTFPSKTHITPTPVGAATDITDAQYTAIALKQTGRPRTASHRSSAWFCTLNFSSINAQKTPYQLNGDKLVKEINDNNSGRNGRRRRRGRHIPISRSCNRKGPQKRIRRNAAPSHSPCDLTAERTKQNMQRTVQCPARDRVHRDSNKHAARAPLAGSNRTAHRVVRHHHTQTVTKKFIETKAQNIRRLHLHSIISRKKNENERKQRLTLNRRKTAFWIHSKKIKIEKGV